MKKLFIALFVCSFMMVPQTSNAQFLKQLGKIAEDIGNDILSSPTAVSAEKGTCTINGLTCNLKSVARKDKKLQFVITFENGLDDDINIDISTIKAVDAEGNSYSCSIAPRSSLELISGIPVKATVTVTDVPTTISKFAILRLSTYANGKVEWRGVSF